MQQTKDIQSTKINRLYTQTNMSIYYKLWHLIIHLKKQWMLCHIKQHGRDVTSLSPTKTKYRRQWIICMLCTRKCESHNIHNFYALKNSNDVSMMNTLDYYFLVPSKFFCKCSSLFGRTAEPNLIKFGSMVHYFGALMENI